MEMDVRRRNVPVDNAESSFPNKLEKYDVFTKLPPEYQERSLSGATVSIISFTLILIMIILEVWGYINSPVKFTFDVDKDHDSKLRINIDITVAMPCISIGADVVDTTGGTMSSQSELLEEDINFELSDTGTQLYRTMQIMNNHMRSDYSSLRQRIWNNQAMRMGKFNEKLWHKPLDSADRVAGCRIHGSVFVKKVPGNFHVTAGKHMDLGFGSAHAHLTGFMDSSEYNFSHRIHHFSFGDPNSNIVNPLDAEQSIVKNNFHMFQYFIQVVSTRIRTIAMNVDTYQYAVTEQNRSIDHNRGSHGMPGIFMRYDISPMLVNVSDDRSNIMIFLVRLAAIVGGIFTTSGFLHLVLSGIFDMAVCQFKSRRSSELPLDMTI